MRTTGPLGGFVVDCPYNLTMAPATGSLLLLRTEINAMVFPFFLHPVEEKTKTEANKANDKE
jgi:hypothetical protein